MTAPLVVPDASVLLKWDAARLTPAPHPLRGAPS